MPGVAQRCAIGFVSILLPAPAALPAQGSDQWVDVHFHIVGDPGRATGFVAAAGEAIAIMDRSNIRRAVLLSPPRPFESFDFEELRAVQARYPDRFAFLGGGGTLNPMIQEHGRAQAISGETREKFEARAEQIIAGGAKGFGEIAIHHVSLNAGHGYESVPADGPLLRQLADIAARHDVPIDIHFDPVPETVPTPGDLSSPKNPAQLEENVAAFERLLAHNRKARIVWAHAGADPVGFYTPKLVRRLLAKHPNLYCSVRTTYRTNDPMRHPRRGINRSWIRVLEEFPDRFVMGTDSFVVAPDYTGPDGPRTFARMTHIQREGANAVLAHLDADLARKIGHENAIRLYRLDP